MTTDDTSTPRDTTLVDASPPPHYASTHFSPHDDILLSSLHDLHFVLSPSTTILRVSANCLNLLGCEPNLLLGQRLAALVHKDDAQVFSQEIDHALLRPSNMAHAYAHVASSFDGSPRYRPPFRFYCRIRSVVHVGTDYSAFELVGHYQVKMPASLSPLQLMMPPPGIISITARPAFTRKGRLMDGMLELKMEQIRLVRMIREMRREAADAERASWYEGDGGDGDEPEEQAANADTTSPLDHQPQHHLPSSLQHVEEDAFWRTERRRAAAMVSSSNAAAAATAVTAAKRRSRSSPPRLAWVQSLVADGRQALEHQGPAGDGTPARQSDGESPKVRLGDAGIPFFVRPEGYERKPSDQQAVPSRAQQKRKFVARDYCCFRCGTVESPEWRVGPDGPKTLCNACGLKFAKEKKRAQQKLKQEVASPPA